MSTNMFKQAGKTSTVAAAKKKSDKVEIALTDLEDLASVNAVLKALDGLKVTLSESVKDQMKDQFVEAGTNVKHRPDNFRGVEGIASASCELKKRSTASKLSEEEIKLLTKNKITVDVTESVTETFIINPKFKDDQDLLERVSEALAGVDGMPEDFIQLQEGQSKTTVSDEALNQIFAKKPAVARKLLDVVGVLAIKPKLETGDVSDAMELVTTLLADEDE